MCELQVLFLDYDSTPIMNPELLFNGPHMRMYGNLFWPDFPFVPSTINVKPFKKAMVALGLDESTVKVGQSGFGGLGRGMWRSQLAQRLH